MNLSAKIAEIFQLWQSGNQAFFDFAHFTV